MKNQRNQRGKTRALLAALALSTSVAMTAHGAESPPLPEGVAPERVITNDSRTTVRGCIGQLDTPYCAVQTLIAGEMWSNPWLCKLAGQPSGRCHYFRHGDVRNPYYQTMTPVGWIKVDQEVIDKVLKLNDYTAQGWESGDYLFILYFKWVFPDAQCTKRKMSGLQSWDSFCSPEDPLSRNNHFYFGYHLRRIDSEWQVIQSDLFGSGRGDQIFDSLLRVKVYPQPTSAFVPPIRGVNHRFMKEWEDLMKAPPQSLIYHPTPPYSLVAREQPISSRLSLQPELPPPWIERRLRHVDHSVIPDHEDEAALDAEVRDRKGLHFKVPLDRPVHPCIGSNTTPFCAAATALVGELSGEKPWCANDYYEGYCDEKFEDASNNTRWYSIYPSGMLHAPLRSFRIRSHQQTTETIFLITRRCEASISCLPVKYDSEFTTRADCMRLSCWWWNEPMAFHLRKENGQWRLVWREHFVDRDRLHGSLENADSIVSPYEFKDDMRR
ncbi:MAG: hypothetical protein HQL51_16770 [Magnetococcales bacterium]|nr:hypothetical protein [Magnetococcales bacterium]